MRSKLGARRASASAPNRRQGRRGEAWCYRGSHQGAASRCSTGKSSAEKYRHTEIYACVHLCVCVGIVRGGGSDTCQENWVER